MNLLADISKKAVLEILALAEDSFAHSALYSRGRLDLEYSFMNLGSALVEREH
jgi:hypothetical protein